MSTPLASGWEVLGDWRGQHIGPDQPDDPQPGDIWFDPADDAGQPVPPSGIGELTDRVTAVESTVAGPRSITPAAAVALTPRSGVWVDRVAWQTPTDTTVTPSGGVDGQILRPAVQATGGQRTVAFHQSVRTSTGLTVREFPVPAGQILIAALERQFGVWILTAATVSG